MQPSLGFDISRSSFCICVEIADANPSPVESYARSELFTTRAKRDAKKFAGLVVGVWATLVLHVLRLVSIAEVVPTIVRSVAVNVVNLSFGPRVSHVQPRKAMSEIDCSVNLNRYVATASSRARGVSNFDYHGCAYTPRKKACKRIVIEQFAQALRAKIGFSHEAVLSLIGQRPASVDRTCGPCHFNPA
jgi:hypothetical protein